MPETMRRTALGHLVTGSPVNLEPALAYGDEVGGHLIQGHIDGTGQVVELRDEGNAQWLGISLPAEVRSYCVVKGSIAIDGISLTIAALTDDTLNVSLIPHTLQSTIASQYRVGTEVNLEADILAKYVARYMAESEASARESTGPGPGGHQHKEAG
jgi:riboflavin synthase